MVFLISLKFVSGLAINTMHIWTKKCIIFLDFSDFSGHISWLFNFSDGVIFFLQNFPNLCNRFRNIYQSDLPKFFARAMEYLFVWSIRFSGWSVAYWNFFLLAKKMSQKFPDLKNIIFRRKKMIFTDSEKKMLF